MKQRIFALCVVLLAFGFTPDRAAATAEDFVTLAPAADGTSLLDRLLNTDSGSCPGDSAASSLPAAMPGWHDSSGCCPRTCNVNSDCDPVCGPGAGECKKLGSCCSFCLCSISGS